MGEDDSDEKPGEIAAEAYVVDRRRCELTSEKRDIYCCGEKQNRAPEKYPADGLADAERQRPESGVSPDVLVCHSRGITRCQSDQ